MSQNHPTQGIQETKVTLPIRQMKKAIVTVLFILLVLLILRIKFLFVGINLSLPENTGSQPPACQVASGDKLAEGDTPDNSKGFALQYPRFSPDGKKLIWSERYKKGGIGNYLVGKGEFGWWRIKIADFSLTATGPRLDNIEELEPAGKGFYEPHGVSPDGSKLIFSGAVTSGKTQIYSDIYVYDLNNRKLSKLTSARNIHHEQALYSPSGNKISYMSGPFVGLSDFGYKADLYLMDENGNNRTRLTYFNDPENASYPGQTSQIDKDTWFSDGTAIVFGLYIHKINKFYIYKLTFNDSCGKL